MRTSLKPTIILILLLTTLSFPGLSQAQESKRKIPAQWAITQTPGAAVYKVPNFDAPVLGYLEQGEKVLASRKIYKGIGGLGTFYRVRTQKGLQGFVSDIDLVPQFKGNSPQKSEKESSILPPGSENPQYEEVEDIIENREPFYFTRYIGGTLGSLEFTEKFSGQELSAATTMYGLRMVGPRVLFDGPPLDFGVSFHLGGPDYYQGFTGSPATGFFLFSDLLINLPLLELSDTLIHYGLGLMSTYTKFRVLVRDSYIDSQELRLGAAFSLGASYRYKKYALRFDAKYYYEKTQYTGYWLSIMTEY